MLLYIKAKVCNKFCGNFIIYFDRFFLKKNLPEIFVATPFLQDVCFEAKFEGNIFLVLLQRLTQDV